MAALQKIGSGKNYELYTDGKDKVIKMLVRLSHPHFGAPQEQEGDSGKKRITNGGVAMLPKSTHVEAKDAFVKIMNEIMENAPNDKGSKGVKIPPEYKCIKNGDDKDREEYQDHWVINFSQSKPKPAIRRKDGSVIQTDAEIDNLFYGGCWAYVMLRPWYFDGKAKGDSKTYPKRIACGFIGAQFVRDDTPFGAGRIDDTNAWGSVDDGEAGGDDGLNDDDDL